MRVAADPSLDTDRNPPSPLELDLDAIVCPYAFYAHARQNRPAPYYVEALGGWLITRTRDIRAVAADSENFSHRFPLGPRYASAMRTTMAAVLSSPDATPEALAGATMGRWEVLFTADPPDHQRQRQLVRKTFSPRQIKLAEPQVREIATRLVDRFAARGTVEMISEFAWPLPLEVIARRLGVPLADLPTFRRWSEDLAEMIGNPELSTEEVARCLESFGAFHTYFAEQIERARETPRDDILGLLAATDGLSQQEILGMLVQFLVAGNETTTNFLGTAMLRLARAPRLAAQLRSEPERIPAYVEESLRLEPPAQGIFRLATRDVPVSGVTIPAGDHVFLPYTSANRDPGSYPRPDEVDLLRAKQDPHLAFGWGPHHCLGAPLARLEGRVALEVLLSRMGELRVDDHDVEYHSSFVNRGLKELKLHFTPI